MAILRSRKNEARGGSGLDTGDSLLRLENISKTFPGVKALKGVNMDVRPGEIHGLVGENGAGKSTLIKVLTGAHQADPGGRIFWQGEEIQIRNPEDAKKMGIGVVYQEIMMATHLSVGENFFLGNLPLKGKLIDWKTVNARTKEIMDELGIQVNPKSILRNLSVAKQEMVTIAKTVYDNARLVIFDEPTALLTNDEVETLFKIINSLTAKGVGIIYISHRMEEIFKICHRVTVLKDGEYVGTHQVKELDETKLISMMVGRKLEDMYNIQHMEPGEMALEVKGLNSEGKFEDINFQVRRGEILGFYGLVGSGRTEIMRAVTGADRFDSGELYFEGKRVSINSPVQSKDIGIAFLTEDRKTQGLGMSLTVEHNVNMASYGKISRLGVINLKREHERAEKYREEIRIKTPSVSQMAKNLSGGNQQKVVIAKWLACESKVFIFDEPTVGIDVAAKREIYLLIEKLLKDGAAIILISSYLPEVMGLSDRIIVMHEGKISGQICRSDYEKEMDEALFVSLASGIDLGKTDHLEGR